MFSLLVCKFFVFKDAHTSSIAKAGTEEAIRKSKISESQFEKGLTYMIFDIIKGSSSLKSYKDLIFKRKKNWERSEKLCAQNMGLLFILYSFSKFSFL